MSAIAKAVGRRFFARGALGVPLVLSRGPGAVISGSASYGPPAAVSAATTLSFTERVWKALRISTRPQQQTNDIRYYERSMMGGLDPDLAVLNSMSVTRRVQIQIEREIAERKREQSLRHQIIRSLGGDPNDFE